MEHGRCRGDTRVRFARFAQRTEAVLQRGGRIGDQRRTKAADAVLPANPHNVADRVDRQRLRTETMAAAAVDLKIKQGWRDPTCVISSGRCGGGADGRDAALLRGKLDQLAGGVVAGADLHDGTPPAGFTTAPGPTP